MLKAKLQKLKIWIKQVYQYFISRNNVIIFIGNNGTFLVAAKNDKYIESSFIPRENRENLEHYKNFLKKYADCYIFFLSEDEHCKLEHASIPIFQSVIAINPVKQFIIEHCRPEDIVSFKVYDITSKSGEIWNTVISKIPYIPPTSNLLNYVISSNLKFGGIYHLSLEYINIINKILKHYKEDSKFQIFIYISQANAIKFVIKQDEDIVAIKAIDYPVDRTEYYILGIIEQEINDYLIYYKHHLQLCLIFLVTDSFKNLLTQAKFIGVSKIIYITNSDFNKSYTAKVEEQSIDNLLVKLFFSNRNFLGSNKTIKSITRLNLINFLFVKILNSTVIILLLFIFGTKYSTYKSTLEEKLLNARNTKILQDYRDIEVKYSNTGHTLNSADLYNLTLSSHRLLKNPFTFLEKFLNNLPSNVDLEEIKWQINMPGSLELVNLSSYATADISIRYNVYNLDEAVALKEVDKYKEKIQTNFNDFIVCSLTSHDTIKFLDKLVIPISFSVKTAKDF